MAGTADLAKATVGIGEYAASYGERVASQRRHDAQSGWLLSGFRFFFVSAFCQFDGGREAFFHPPGFLFFEFPFSSFSGFPFSDREELTIAGPQVRCFYHFDRGRSIWEGVRGVGDLDLTAALKCFARAVASACRDPVITAGRQAVQGKGEGVHFIDGRQAPFGV